MMPARWTGITHLYFRPCYSQGSLKDDMGWLELLKEWINERGSAAIMQKQLDFCNAQKAALEKDLDGAQQRIKTLERDNAQLQTDLQSVKTEIDNLKSAFRAQPITTNTRFDPRKF